VHVRPAEDGGAAASTDPSGLEHALAGWREGVSSPARGVNRWVGTVQLLRAAPGGVSIVTAEHPDLAVEVPSAAAVSLDLAPGARLACSVAESDVSVRAAP
jgi:molybdate transport system ATP-binding protein